MSQKSTKQATKGQKQILEENQETIKFYTRMTAASLGTYLLFYFVVYSSPVTYSNWFFIIFSILVYGGCLSTMKMMAKPSYSESGSLIDGGIDLNMLAGFSEHLKDVVILTAITQILAIISIYFWNLWLLAPFRAFYMLWVSVIGPWIFEAPPDEQEEEVNDKKQKKQERRMKRMQKFQ